MPGRPTRCRGTFRCEGPHLVSRGGHPLRRPRHDRHVKGPARPATVSTLCALLVRSWRSNGSCRRGRLPPSRRSRGIRGDDQQPEAAIDRAAASTASAERPRASSSRSIRFRFPSFSRAPSPDTRREALAASRYPVGRVLPLRLVRSERTAPAAASRTEANDSVFRSAAMRQSVLHQPPQRR